MLRFQLERRAVLAAIATFLGLVFFAMRAYPGGTSWNATAPGHDFWLNYLCDLARPTALNGAPNPTGSALAQAAMVALAIGLVPWWSLVARLAPSQPRTEHAFVAALPGDRFGRVHGFACVAAGVPGLAAGVLAVVTLFRDRHAPRAARWVGAATLLAAASCFTLYLPDVLSLGSALMIVAVLERISVGLLLLWMLVCSAPCRTS